jgi:hypothetical protein
MTLDTVDMDYFVQVHEEIGPILPDDIAVSCPICREGKSWGRKHRLHLYIKPGYDSASIKCFNCGLSTNMYGYLKENHPNEYTSYRKAVAGRGFAELRMAHEKEDSVKTTELDFSNVDIGINLDTPLENKLIEEPKKILIPTDGFEDDEAPMDMSTIGGMDFGFDMSTTDTSVTKTKPEVKVSVIAKPNIPNLIDPISNLTKLPDDAVKYINNRGLEVQESWMYSGKNNKIRFNNTDIVLSEYIIIPLTMSDKWYGFQALAWKQKKFFVYLVTGNTSWKVENWDAINKEEPVYIFESIYDRLSSGFLNSIAVLGSNLHDDRIAQLKEPIFCLDNQNVDEKSIEESMKYLKMGYKCFLWPSGSDKFKDTNDLRKINVPYEKIQTMINNNTYHGMKGILKLKFYN